MQFTNIFASALAMASAAAASPVTQRATAVTMSGDYVYKIDNLFIRKLDGSNISAMGFDISATNGGTLDFTCSPYDKSAGKAPNPVKDDTFYSCGKNSSFSFAFQSDRNGLLLRQKAAGQDSYTLLGTATLPNYCHAGGAGPMDYACVGTSDAYVTMVRKPSA